MAEFQEVMRQWERMCESIGVHDRIKCPLVHALDIPNCESCSESVFIDPAHTEEIVMSWAAEHPEPKYPTWWEWLSDSGFVAKKVPPDFAFELIETGLVEPIPADVAEKLGIQPKEG